MPEDNITVRILSDTTELKTGLAAAKEELQALGEKGVHASGQMEHMQHTMARMVGHMAFEAVPGLNRMGRMIEMLGVQAAGVGPVLAALAPVAAIGLGVIAFEKYTKEIAKQHEEVANAAIEEGKFNDKLLEANERLVGITEGPLAKANLELKDFGQKMSDLPSILDKLDKNLKEDIGGFTHFVSVVQNLTDAFLGLDASGKLVGESGESSSGWLADFESAAISAAGPLGILLEKAKSVPKVMAKGHVNLDLHEQIEDIKESAYQNDKLVDGRKKLQKIEEGITGATKDDIRARRDLNQAIRQLLLDAAEEDKKKKADAAQAALDAARDAASENKSHIDAQGKLAESAAKAEQERIKKTASARVTAAEESLALMKVQHEGTIIAGGPEGSPAALEAQKQKSYFAAEELAAQNEVISAKRELAVATAESGAAEALVALRNKKAASQATVDAAKNGEERTKAEKARIDQNKQAEQDYDNTVASLALDLRNTLVDLDAQSRKSHQESLNTQLKDDQEYDVRAIDLAVKAYAQKSKLRDAADKKASEEAKRRIAEQYAAPDVKTAGVGALGIGVSVGESPRAKLEREEAEAMAQASEALEEKATAQKNLNDAKAQYSKLQGLPGVTDAQLAAAEMDVAKNKAALDVSAANYQKYVDKVKSLQAQLRAQFALSVESMTSAFNSGIQKWLTGSERFSVAMKHVMQKLALDEAMLLVKMGEYFAQKEAKELIQHVTGKSKQLAIDKGAAAASAAVNIAAAKTERSGVAEAKAGEAAAIVFEQSIEAIPFPANLAAAPLNATVVHAQVIAAAAARGGIMPDDQLLFASRDEMILPPKLSAFVQQAADTAGSGSREEARAAASGDTHFHYTANIHAIDTIGMSDALKKHSGTIAGIVNNEVRRRNHV